jgi:hypothetical protein
MVRFVGVDISKAKWRAAIRDPAGAILVLTHFAHLTKFITALAFV